ncbi:MAG: PAS domain-containing protein [Pseudomonadota bacterium]
MTTAKNPQPRRTLQLPARAHATSAHGPTELVVLSLNDQGVIRGCSEACHRIFGYAAAELAGCHISTLLPQLPSDELVRDGRIDARLAYLCHCGHPFQARHRNGQHFGIELFINRLDHHNVAVLVRRLDARAPADAAVLAH